MSTAKTGSAIRTPAASCKAMFMSIRILQQCSFFISKPKKNKIREFQNYIMTKADQVLPTSSSIEDVPNADGSITRTTTITYDDGSKTTKQEIVPSPDGQQEVSSSTPARIEPRNCLQIVSFVLFIAAILGIVVYFFLRAVVRASTSPC